MVPEPYNSTYMQDDKLMDLFPDLSGGGWGADSLS